MVLQRVAGNPSTTQTELVRTFTNTQPHQEVGSPSNILPEREKIHRALPPARSNSQVPTTSLLSALRFATALHLLPVQRMLSDSSISASTQMRTRSAMLVPHPLFLSPPSNSLSQNITLLNVAGGYQSPARTATHIHQAARGASGPPRLAFPNPIGDDKRRVSVGCLTGPFTTGLMMNGADTGAGFKVKQIEQNPAGFFADSHTTLFSLGVVRGQLA